MHKESAFSHGTALASLASSYIMKDIE